MPSTLSFRTFVYDDEEMLCSLFEGLINTGSVIRSNKTTTMVGGLIYSEDLFINYNQSCEKCSDNRYLQCSMISSLCDCPIHSFFNGFICENQFYHGYPCLTSKSCRDELGLQCIVRICQCTLGSVWNNQNCTTLSPITTVAGSGSGGTLILGPVDHFLTSNGTLYEVEWGANRVQIFMENNSNAVSSYSGIINPRGICVDRNSSSFYVAGNGQVIQWPMNRTVFNLLGAFGLAIDRYNNLYVTSEFHGIVVFWNATSNTTTTILSGLNSPRHLYLDEINQLIYVTDRLNHRVIRKYLWGGSPMIVAGGNANGFAANQLAHPNGVYVADTANHRIQKWIINGTVGITIIGYANGTSNNDLYGLNEPYAVILDASETFLYVADLNNNRIQRIPII